MSFVQQTLGKYLDELSPQLQAAATFVMDQPQEVATHSMRQVARMSNLSPPTFSRLARAVGCSDFEELRELCRTDLKRSISSFADKARALQESGTGTNESGAGNFVVRQAESAIHNIQGLIDAIEPAVIAQVADQLAAAKQVVLIGAMSAHPFVEYMSYMADMAFPHWRVIDQQGAGVASTLAAITERDAVLVISKHPYARHTLEATRIAHARGAFVVAITDSVKAPILHFVDQSLQVSTESPQFFPSHVATLVLLESLIAMVLRRSGHEAQKHIESVQATKHSLGEYWQGNTAKLPSIVLSS